MKLYKMAEHCHQCIFSAKGKFYSVWCNALQWHHFGLVFFVLNVTNNKNSTFHVQNTLARNATI